MPTLTAEGVRLHYEVRGDGRPVLLLHGFSSSYRGTWENTGWVDALVEHGFRTIGFDARGHGASDKPDDPREYVSAYLVADAVSVLDALRVSRAHVLGYSLGGGVALGLATAAPDRIRSVAVGGVGDAALDHLADPVQLAAIADALDPTVEATVVSPQARALRENALRSGNDLRALASFMRNGRGWPGGLRRLGPVGAPVLLVVAENDQYMRGHDELRARVPHARVVELAGRDHHTAIHDPTFRVAVLDFFG